ncbi:unnamed protein product [Amoebophrya sp. A25]|nr:unnamed protein product [Amoebophrya sp. A25]|eukprot:GSA25T00015205001.1
MGLASRFASAGRSGRVLPRVGGFSQRHVYNPEAINNLSSSSRILQPCQPLQRSQDHLVGNRYAAGSSNFTIDFVTRRSFASTSGNKMKNEAGVDIAEGLSVPHFRKGGSRLIKKEAAAGSEAAENQNVEVRQELVRKPSVKLTDIQYGPNTYALPMVNHLWTKPEIEKRLKNQPQFQPITMMDKAMYHLVKTVLYRGFNYFSGFNYENPTVKSCEFRLILLESIAGVPGMVAAVIRHFNSLRTLKRDHGWIHTLLEEAQNERMHLLVCMRTFEAGLLTRLMVFGAQFVMVPFLTTLYIVHPRSLHRFVGYLEETAVKTYTDLIRLTQTEGTHLHKKWATLKAPDLAKAYWNLDDDAMWIEVLENLMADETNHRDVNHKFANMDADEPNPYIEKHIEDIANFDQREGKFFATDAQTTSVVSGEQNQKQKASS